MEFCIASYPKERRIRTPYIDLSSAFSFRIPFESFPNRGDNNRSGKTNFCCTIRNAGTTRLAFQLFIHDANGEKGSRDWIRSCCD